MDTRESRLVARGYSLDLVPGPAANYVPATSHGRTAYLSGTLPSDADRGLVFSGKVGADLDVEAAQRAAALCAVNLLRAFRRQWGSLDAIERVLQVRVYVNSTGDFDKVHLVANGASDLLGHVLGEAGRHARSAIGVAALPLGAAVEVDATFSLVAP